MSIRRQRPPNRTAKTIRKRTSKTNQYEQEKQNHNPHPLPPPQRKRKRKRKRKRQQQQQQQQQQEAQQGKERKQTKILSLKYLNSTYSLTRIWKGFIYHEPSWCPFGLPRNMDVFRVPFLPLGTSATVGLFVLEERQLKVSRKVLHSKGRNPPILPWSLMLSPPEKDSSY